MSFEQLMGSVQQMSAAVDALAAVGAELHLKSSGTQVDPAIESALARVSAAAGVPDLDSIPAPQREIALVTSDGFPNVAHSTITSRLKCGSADAQPIQPREHRQSGG